MAKYRVLVLSLALIWILGSSLPVSSQSATSPLPGTQSLREARALTVVQEPAGDLWAAWEADTGTDVEIYFSHWTPKGWATPKPVHSRPQAWDYDPSLAIAADGQLWLAWSSAEHGSPRQSKLYVSRWTGTGWTEPDTVPTSSLTRSREPVLAAPGPASAGHLLSENIPSSTLWLAWVGYDGTGDGIFASRWDGKTWQSPQQVSAPDDDPVLYDRQPQLAVDRDGKPWLVWTGHERGVDDEIYVSRWTGDAWTPEQMLNQDDDELDVSPSLVLDAQDQPWVAWEGILPGGDLPQSRIMVSHWDPAREAWTPESVASSPPEAEILETSPTLAFHPDGQMHLAWVASDFSTPVVVHAQMVDGQWAAPRLAGAALADEPVVLILVADGSASALRLDSLQDAQVPVERLDLDPNAQPLARWIEDQPAPDELGVAAIANRYLAFGDSITWGLYTLIPDPVPYPTILEQSLDTRVKPSAVINSGVPGNSTYHGVERIKTEVPSYQPQFVLYMLGTNDVSRAITPSKVRKNIDFTIRIARQSGVPNVEFMVATIIPRSDGRFDETEEMNELGIKPAAVGRKAPICDQWQAFLDYGPWRDILVDGVHPKQVGLQLLADTFYGCILDSYTWLEEDSVPPVISLQLPAQSDCTQVNASWSGTDNLSWVVNYDVQIREPGSSIWTNWLLQTQATNAIYSGGVLGDTVGVRVRGRDVIGNQSDYNLATKDTTLVDNTPPLAHPTALLPYQVAPFSVSWTGHDSCTGIQAYDVQRRVGSGSWQNWLTGTTNTSATFVPDPPQYGQLYQFQVRARDGVGLWSAWAQVSTTLARFALDGHVYNVRHEPVFGATVSLSPPAAHVRQYGDGFTAYLMASGNYDVLVSRNDRFGTLPPMHREVSDNVTGLEFILPPQATEDAVTDGGFEQGTLAAWQVGGTQPPVLNPQAHTGAEAVLMGGIGHSSVLSQTLSVPGTLTDATLSFLVKLENPTGDSSTIDVELVGTSISHAQVVPTGEWTHVWFPVEAALGQAVTLRFAVSNNPAVRLDEVSLGSALSGGSTIYMPTIRR